MKRLILGLFVLAALALALHPLYASEPPFAPFAVCKDGKCVMSEADYTTYRQWHFALIQRMRDLQEENSGLNAEVGRLQNRLVAEAFCERHRD